MGSEAELLARCRRGEESAWEELFARHYAATARFIHQAGHDFTPEDTDEICQEVFLSVIRNLHSFNGASQFQTWLYRIAANKCQDVRERRQAAKRGGGQQPISLQAENRETGLTLDPPSSEDSPDLKLARKEDCARLMVALGSLDEPCREVIQLRYFAELSYQEIAGALQLNEKTVSSRLSKCLDKLEQVVIKAFAGESSSLFPSNTSANYARRTAN